MIIPESISYRKKPVNYVDRDNDLFQSEWQKNLPLIKTENFNSITCLPDLSLYQKGKPFKLIDTKVKTVKSFKSKINYLRKKNINLTKSIWLTDTWSSNYFHWFTDVLPRIIIAKDHFKGIPVILPAYFANYKYIYESLEAFQEIEIIWLKNFQKARSKGLIFIPNLAPTGNYNEDILKKLNFFLRKAFNLDKITPHKKIMISRQDAPNRRILNLDELNDILETEKIETITFGKLSWKEQIKTAASSTFLMGVHGAGLTNMLFMEEGSSILEFRKINDNMNNCYFSMASALNLSYYYQLCEVDKPTELTQNNNFVVQTSELQKILKEVAIHV